MRRRTFRAEFCALAGIALSAACGSGSGPQLIFNPQPDDPAPPSLTLVSVATGFTNPLDFQEPADGTGRFFVVEQAGFIRIVENGTLITTPFLDLTARAEAGGEKGLLGLAFHPDFAQNRRFFVNYTRRSAGQLQTVIAEYRASLNNPNAADPSETILLTVNQPFDNHNGGQLAFGPDGFLYIALGDGGSGGDPQGNGQNLNSLLGALLRIDVDSAAPSIAIPPDNPFASVAGLDEIWAYGLRNPWRFSFDSMTGDLFLADVGQDRFEEVNLIERGGNYGWNVMEGSSCFSPSSGCNMTGLILPIAEYGRSEGSSVTGGYVYRGALIPGLRGSYVFGDFISGRIWGLTRNTSGDWVRSLLLETGSNISSFGQDRAGEIYVLDYGAGTVRQLREAGS
jgi:glucose/arabinose dehydrogenase